MEESEIPQEVARILAREQTIDDLYAVATKSLDLHRRHAKVEPLGDKMRERITIPLDLKRMIVLSRLMDRDPNDPTKIDYTAPLRFDREDGTNVRCTPVDMSEVIIATKEEIRSMTIVDSGNDAMGRHVSGYAHNRGKGDDYGSDVSTPDLKALTGVLGNRLEGVPRA